MRISISALTNKLTFSMTKTRSIVVYSQDFVKSYNENVYENNQAKTQMTETSN